MNITNWNVGDRVKISKESWLNIRNSSRSILAYPDDHYTHLAYDLMCYQVQGTVTMKFPPGYEVNVTFDDGLILQVKDHWIVRA
jgi:hypothetical protein